MLTKDYFDMNYLNNLSALNEYIGGRIRMKRKQRKMTLQQLGEYLKLTPQQTQKYEKGKQKITAEMLWDLSKLFNVPIQFFYEGFIDTDSTILEEEQTEFNYNNKKETEELIDLYYKLKNRKALMTFLHMIVDNEKEG